MDGGVFTFHDLAPSEESFRDAVLAGLGHEAKTPPCKFFYDARGSALFEEICEVPEYYLTRTEIAILEEHAGAIAAYIGAHCRLVELGSGSSRKVRILLEALETPAAYVPVDISREHLREAAAGLAADFPNLNVIAVCADYTRPFPLPPLPGPAGKRVGFFPGSTIGNFEPDAVVRFLAHCAELLGPEGEMLIGVDLKKDPSGGDIDVARFEHLAFYSAEKGRMELYLKSLADQTATIAGHPFHFAEGERIYTENSYKYAVPEFRALAARAGFRAVHTWTDRNQLFSVHYFRQR